MHVWTRADARVRLQDYFVFYRIVDKKYILYQMNTLLLQQLRTGREWPLEEDELIITPSLNEKYYPYRLEDCFPLFARDLNDESAQLANSLLSVNNGLIVQEKEAFAKVHMVHYIEAQPVRFFYGYDQSVSYKQVIIIEYNDVLWVSGVTLCVGRSSAKP